MRLSAIFIILLYSLSAFSTSFVPISIKKQIYEADGIIYGTVVELSSEANPEVSVVTKVKVKLDKWVDINPNDKFFEVYFPGGMISEKTVVIDGAPTFNLEEKVVLFLGKDDQDKYWIKNLGLGKYTEKRLGNSQVLVNQIFPNHPDIGQISSKIFFELAQRLKDKNFDERLKDKYEHNDKVLITSVEEKKGRSIASVHEDQIKTAHWLKVTWLLIILVSLFFISSWIRRRLR